MAIFREVGHGYIEEKGDMAIVMERGDMTILWE